MQAVPSLIGTGTAVAAAATGVIFGQLAEGQVPPPPPHTTPIRNYIFADELEPNRSAYSSRPGTTDSAAVVTDNFGPPASVYHESTAYSTRMPRYSQPAQQVTSPKSSNRRSIHGKQGDVNATPVTEDVRSSSSSNGSWMRRLSIRPISQHESSISSLGPDCQSMFSHGSAAPILSPSSITAPQLPPNKLVKRSSAANGATQGLLERRSARSQMPTLRRPATSHQRSATLHQLTVEAVQPASKLPSEQRQHGRPRAKTLAVPKLDSAVEISAGAETRWKSFFHSRITRLAVRTSTKRSDHGAQLGDKRLRVDQTAYERAYLITPGAVAAMPAEYEIYDGGVEADTSAIAQDSPQGSNKTDSSRDGTPSRTNSRTTPKRSLSIQLGSATNWRSRNGSLRRRKRGAGMEASATDHRHTSDSANSKTASDEKGLAPNSARVNSNASQARTSTVASSEYHRGLTSGEDDDTTDTPFDSLRTTGSGRRKTLDSPVESMFDESPPNTAGIVKQPKRLSIQEILGPSFDVGNKIMEEDEGQPTPVRNDDLQDDEESDYLVTQSGAALSARDFGRLSLDDEEDLDWPSDDHDVVYNHLSPPSSMNSRRGSPHPRTALTMVNGNGVLTSGDDNADERPRSNIWDWQEPVSREKHEAAGLRPKTVHGKQELDMRGGRAASRRGHAPVHVRSQSVPVVPEPILGSKMSTKFPTWGKKVSEDWDDDFEFEEPLNTGSLEDTKAANRLSIIRVPSPIQAQQPTFKAHSGHIREVSLLVNDLKRLCRLGREMGILDGSQEMWREAERIITLCEDGPDDSELSATSPENQDSGLFDSDLDLSTPGSNLNDDRFVDEGFDGSILDRTEVVGKFNEQMKTAVIKERSQTRRRSVFSPEDDIFGGWLQTDKEAPLEGSPTPKDEPSGTHGSANVVSLEGPTYFDRRQRTDMSQPTDMDYADGTTDGNSDGKPKADSKRMKYFDTSSLRDLVKRAGDLRDSLSDLIRKEDRITSSPIRTPRREKPKHQLHPHGQLNGELAFHGNQQTSADNDHC
ncbi:Nitrite reductase [NAD(P)H] [Pestalotiopsis sp. IQ-011]